MTTGALRCSDVFYGRRLAPYALHGPRDCRHTVHTHLLPLARSPIRARPNTAEVTRLALDRGLLAASHGLTPHASMASALYLDVRDHGATTPFIK